MTEPARRRIGRRRALAVLGGAMAVPHLLLRPALATPAEVEATIRRLAGEAPVQRGRVMLDMPPLAENGNAVPVTVSVESPMTEADHVRSIALFAAANPLPEVARFHLGPRAGRAQVATRIRLADSQTVTALAELSDGSLWFETAEMIVTIAACVEN
jgi:sulfur-oxidizing protein SoxY